MATHMVRRLTRNNAVLGVTLRQCTRFVSTNAPRMIFSASKLSSQSSLCNISPLFRPQISSIRFSHDGPIATVEEIEERVINVLKMFDKVNPEQVSMEAHFVNDLGLDSLDVVEIVMAFEDEFGIEVSDVEAEKIFTCRDAVNLSLVKLHIGEEEHH